MNQPIHPSPDSASAEPASARVSDAVQEAMAVTLRGCEELIPQADWQKKLVKI